MSDSFSKTLTYNSINFKCAVGTSDRYGREFHPFYEIILFKGGKAELVADTMHITLKPDTLIVIPKGAYHQLVITGNQSEYYRCVLDFIDEECAQSALTDYSDVFIMDPDKNILYLFDKMSSLTDSDDSPIIKEKILRACLTLILSEITPNNMGTKRSGKADNLSSKVIEYIDSNLSEPLTAEKIAEALNSSVSSLAHTFKKDMNISVHQYILKKRLIKARQKIMGGEPVIKAALDCGFNDYSGFYKQYKKMFNEPPSKNSNLF